MSPLFALEAEELLLNGEIAEAIELCEKGLEEYPDYPAALSILAKAHEMSGNSEKSQEIMNQARNFLTSNKSHAYISDTEIAVSSGSSLDTDTDSSSNELIESESDTESAISSISSLDEATHDTLRMSELIDERFNGNSYISKLRESGFTQNGEMSRLIEHSTSSNTREIPVDMPATDEFLRMAEKIEGAKIPIAKEIPSEQKSTGKMNIVTDTIAEILEKQGAINEALNAWQVLQNIHPDKSEFYESKIAALNAKIN